MTDVDNTLNERANTHGKFEDVAHYYRYSMRLLENHGEHLTDSQYMALSMIFGKVARVLSGNPDFVDHWHDMQGYAKLVEDQLLANKS